MEAIWHHPFYVNGWLVDPRLHRISNKGETVWVEPKVMQVLTLLAAHPGEVLDREALLDEVWGDTVVTDHVLTRSISELRKVFGDDAREPFIIETIPKRGYRLIAAVTLAGDSVGISSPGDTSPNVSYEVSVSPTFVERPSTASHPAFRPLLWPLLGLAILALSISAWLFLKPQNPLQPLRSQPLTSFRGIEDRPLFSPDGQRVAFLWQKEMGGVQQLFVKQVGEEVPLQLTEGNTSIYFAAWSPDGNHLAFRRSDRTQCGIYLVSALGGPERKLYDCTTSRFSLDWSPDGTWLAATYVEETTRGLVLIEVETGATRRLTTIEHRGSDHQPVFSPDGTQIAFLRALYQGMEDIFVVPVTGDTPPRQLTSDRCNVVGLTWTTDGKTLVFSSNRTGSFKLWKIPAKGGSPRWMAEAGAYDPGAVQISSDGKMAFAEWDYEINIRRTALQTSTPQTPSSQPWLASTRWDFYPRYAPDGSRIAFTSNRSGTTNLWISQADGSQAMQLTHFPDAFVGLSSWSPDGRSLVFDATTEGQASLYRIDAAGGQPRLLRQDTLGLKNPTWSRDGKKIYFSALQEGQWQLWTMTPTGDEAMPLTREGGYLGMESEDGQTLYFSHFNTPGLWQMPAQGGEATKILEPLWISQWGNWTLHTRGIYYVDVQTSPPLLKHFDLTEGTTTEIRALPGSMLGIYPALSISPDGQWLLFSSADRVESDLILVTLP